MQKIDLIKKNVRGVEGSFLMKNGTVAECDLGDERVHYISKSIGFLIESIVNTNKDLVKISIDADKACTLFFYDVYVLGIVTSSNTNFPLLTMVSNKLLYTIEELPEKTEEILEEVIDEVLKRMDTFIE